MAFKQVRKTRCTRSGGLFAASHISNIAGVECLCSLKFALQLRKPRWSVREHSYPENTILLDCTRASVVRGTKTLPSHTRRYADRHAIALNAHSATMQSQTHLLTYGWAHRHSPLESPRSFDPVLEGLGTSNGRLKLPFCCIGPLQIMSQTSRRPYPNSTPPCHSLTAGHPVMTRHAAT